MGARAFAQIATERVAWVASGQIEVIEAAGAAIAEAIAAGHRIWVTQTSHTLHTEATRRAGGLMAVDVLEDPADLAAGDVVLAGTSAGTFEDVIETALVAVARGAVVVALTQLPFELDERVPVAHGSGRRLSEIAHLVVDLGGPFGDGEFTLADPDGRQVQVIPSSGITGVLALWMILAEALERLVLAGTPPLVWQSNLIPGAPERNAALMEVRNRTGKGYRDVRT